MQREILFRGKRADNGEWAEGYYLVAAGMAFMSVFGVRSPVQVDCDTVGQYTGLTDQNGRKIFEGDILNFFNSDGEYTNYEVGWFKNRWSVVKCGTDSTDALDMFFCEHSDIIGNIHDNPELLEVSE